MFMLISFGIAMVVVYFLSLMAVVLIEISRWLLPASAHRISYGLLVVTAILLSIWVVEPNGLMSKFYGYNGGEFFPPPARHACGGPYVAGAGECENKLWDTWMRESPEVGHRYTLWLMTPPPLRSSCEWVNPRFCEMIKSVSALESWAVYILCALCMLFIILLPLAVIRLHINGSVFPRRIPVLDSAAP